MNRISLSVMVLFAFPPASENELLIKAWPVAGPLAAAGMKQSISATFTWDGSGRGTVTTLLPDGEACSGEYACLSKRTPAFFHSEDYHNFYGGNLPQKGLQYGQALLTGACGTIIKAEFYINLRANQRFGLARDNRNNIYQFL